MQLTVCTGSLDHCWTLDDREHRQSYCECSEVQAAHPTHRQSRLQKLAQTKLPIPDSQSGESTPSTPIPSAMGLSVSGLRQAIRRVERSIESEVIDHADGQDTSLRQRRHEYRKSSPPITDSEKVGNGHESDGGLRVHLKDSQLRMAIWLNTLPWTKVLTWYPEISNSHAVIIVRYAFTRIALNTWLEAE